MRLPDIHQIQAFEDIQTTIMEGREGTPMPSWSVRFAGPMNDQQIQDLLNYLTEINKENVPRGGQPVHQPVRRRGGGGSHPGALGQPGVPQDEGGTEGGGGGNGDGDAGGGGSSGDEEAA